MASLANTMAGTAVGLGAVALVGRSAGMAKDAFDFNGKKKKKKKKKFVGGMVDLMVGSALLGGAAAAANTIP